MSLTPASVEGRFGSAHCILLILFVSLWMGAATRDARAQLVSPPDPAPTFPVQVGGAWGPVIEWPHVPVSMANLPDGRVLTFASNEPNHWPGSASDEYTHAAVWDPKTGSIRSVPHPSHDMFCASVVTLESGETFVMGGRNGVNSPWVSYFDFHRDRWVQFDASQDMNNGRWYPTAVYLGSGEVFIAGGIGGGIHPELWREDQGWTVLSGIDLTSSLFSLGMRDGGGLWSLLTLAPDGTIFHHGATEMMHRFDPFGGPGGLGTTSELGPHGFGWFPDEGVSVAYDAGRILVAGGSAASNTSRSSASAYTVDINGPGPTLTPTGSMNYPRQFLNEVVLPTGDVLVVGGNTNGQKFNDDYAIRNAEIWDPETGTWTLLNPQDQARTYHSGALLLLDGTVFSAGGGLNGDACDGEGAPGECGVDHWNAEIYSPPYLFDANGQPASRPVLASAPAVARVGRTITVHGSPGLTGFSMIRMSAATHTMNTDQRFLRPAMVESEPGTYELSLHTNEHVLVPGYWMLFALDGEVPSIARSIQIVNDGVPRGPPIDGFRNDVGDEVLYKVALQDPDGAPIYFFANNLPPGLSISEFSGAITGTTTTPGVFNVSILALDGTEATEMHFSWVVSAERGEFGTFSPTPGVWNLRTLEQTYNAPVVVAGPTSSNDAQPVVVRVRNVTPTSFELLLDEWPYLPSGSHAVESVSYLVVEAGEYVLPGGGALVAGIAPGIDYLNPWTQPFAPGAFQQTPIVLTQVGTEQAVGGSSASIVRVEDVSVEGFSLRLQEQEADNQNMPAEDVHWIAVEPGVLPGLLETAVSAVPVDHFGTSVAFSQGFSSEPHLFAALQSSADLDPATLRQQATSAAGFDLVLQEEASADAELEHAPEIFGWLAIDPAASTLGLLPLFNQPPTIGVPADQTATRGDPVSLAIEAVDPEGGTLVFSATGLPPGLAIDSATGEIEGILGLAGTYVVTVTVTDDRADEDSAVFVWLVESPLEIVPFATPPRSAGDSIEFVAQTNRVGTFDFVWDYGDGSPPIGPTGPTSQHDYLDPGRYVVTLTVSDPVTLQSDVHQFVQVVTAVPTLSAPTASSTIVYEAANDRVWAVNPDQDSLAVVATAPHARIAEIPVSEGPRSLAIAGDGRIWVACKEASTIDIIDPDTLSRVDQLSLPAGSSPHAIVFDPAGTTVFVALEDAGEVRRLEGVSGSLLSTRDIGRDVRSLAVSGDGSTLYAPRFVTPPLPEEAIGVPLGQLGEDPVGGELLMLSAATLETLSTVVIGMSQAPDSATSARGVPNYLGPPAISPDGSELILPGKQDNVFRGLYRDGQPLVHDQTVRAITSRIDLATGLEDLGARVDHDDSSVASAVVYDALGAYAFATLEGSREIAVIDALGHFERGRVATGRAPHGMALSPDGTTLYVDEFMDRSIAVFDLSPLLGFDDPAIAATTRIAKVSSEALSPEVLLGKQLFYDAADPSVAAQGYLSCASCHSEGGHDGRVWDFSDLGEGLRNTIDLRGHGQGHGPLHWTANFDEFQDFEGQIRHFGGSGLMSAEDFDATADPLGAAKAGLSPELDALAAYLASLTGIGASPAREAGGAMTADALAGRALFESETCGRCHAGSEFTDSELGTLYDIGTLTLASGPQTALDTPTLRGLWRTQPYLHDGSAETLEEAIAAHSFVSLDPAALGQLVAYLSQVDDAEPAAPNALPVVTLTSPADASSAIEGDPVVLAATALDLEDGDRTASLRWASDLDGEFGTGGSFSFDGLSVGSHVLTAAATDRSDAIGGSQVSFTVLANETPTIVIASPPAYSVVAEGEAVDLLASASDPEDGDLSAEILWTSDRDGVLGTGDQLGLDGLSLGSHALTAEVTDRHGATRVVLRVISVPEPGRPAALVAGLLCLMALVARRSSRVEGR